MHYYFIDYENVHADGFIGVERITENDIVCVMYTERSKSISLEFIEKIGKQNARIESYKAGVGTKNALDFQLSSYMGYVIAKNSENDAVFYIVSRDTGFDCLVEFWKERNIKVKRIVNFLEEDEDQQSAPKQTDTDQKKKQKNESKVSDDNKVTKEELLQYLTEEEYSDRILEIFNSYKTKVAINNGLSKEFRDNQKSGAIYKKLKVLLKEKKKS